MSRLRNRLRWRVLAIAAILLLTHPADSAKNPKTKDRSPKNKKCPDCIQVRVDSRINMHANTNHIRNFPSRSIVPFKYHNISNPKGIPSLISGVICSDKCLGHDPDMNAVPITRTIHYLRKEKNIYVLEEMNIDVGCTCVSPEVKEQLHLRNRH